jgi:hypothetical protein
MAHGGDKFCWERGNSVVGKKLFTVNVLYNPVLKRDRRERGKNKQMKKKKKKKKSPPGVWVLSRIGIK